MNIKNWLQKKDNAEVGWRFGLLCTLTIALIALDLVISLPRLSFLPRLSLMMRIMMLISVIAQWLVLRKRVHGAVWWVPVSVVSWYVFDFFSFSIFRFFLFNLFSLFRILNMDLSINVIYIEVMAAVMNGIMVSVSQWLILRGKIPKAWWWIPASILGFLGMYLLYSNVVGYVVYIIVTGIALVYLLQLQHAVVKRMVALVHLLRQHAMVQRLAVMIQAATGEREKSIETKTVGDTATNPYVGPRTFTRAEANRFFGREYEASELLSLVISERLTLFYAQSGAGKSSLINTRLVPQLQEAEFAVLPMGRVGGTLPEGVDAVANVFVFNLLLSIDQSAGDPHRFAQMSLPDFLAGLTSEDGEHYHYSADVAAAEAADKEDKNEIYPYVLIIDQFEEIITTHPARWREREGFFHQLDAAMAADPSLWVVLTLREDYMAALESYAPLLADKMRARFYMQRLRHKAALEAIVRPAEKARRPFAAGVAEALVDNLCQIRVHGQNETYPGEFIEPIQLQVVCYELWENLKGHLGDKISDDDLQKAGDVNAALSQFYEEALTGTSDQTNISEFKLRQWFEDQLITEAKTRGTVYQGTEQTAGLVNEAVHTMENQFIVRAEVRAGGRWYELVHDRFVEPILEANRRAAETSILLRSNATLELGLKFSANVLTVLFFLWVVGKWLWWFGISSESYDYVSKYELMPVTLWVVTLLLPSVAAVVLLARDSRIWEQDFSTRNLWLEISANILIVLLFPLIVDHYSPLVVDRHFGEYGYITSSEAILLVAISLPLIAIGVSFLMMQRARGYRIWERVVLALNLWLKRSIIILWYTVLLIVFIFALLFGIFASLPILILILLIGLLVIAGVSYLVTRRANISSQRERITVVLRQGLKFSGYMIIVVAIWYSVFVWDGLRVDSVTKMIELARSSAQADDSESVSLAYTQAVEKVIKMPKAGLSNSICWYGSLDGAAEIVLPACERAVELVPEDGNIRDSRGLARALTGDYAGAIEDFEFYVEWARERNWVNEEEIEKREEWIAELEAGRNPFDAETLEGLR